MEHCKLKATRFLVVPDSFKGTLSAERAAEAIRQGILAVNADAEVRCFPLADGGEGSSSIAANSIAARRIELSVTGPEGEVVDGFYYSNGKTALIELAAASGFTQSNKPKKTAAVATTYGTGQLIAHAIEHGAKTIRVFLGGSATTDGGVGMARALGARFFAADGNELVAIQAAGFAGEQLDRIADYDDQPLRAKLAGVNVAAVVDVDNPLCGPNGAAHTYGPQKGADASTVLELDAALRSFAKVVAKKRGSDEQNTAGVGAAGGAGFGVLTLLGGALIPGSAFFLDLIEFDRQLSQIDVVITGEGQADWQSLHGKLLNEIVSRTATSKTPVVSLCGKNALTEEELRDFPHTRVFGMRRPDAMTNAFPALKELAEVVVARLGEKDKNRSYETH